MVHREDFLLIAGDSTIHPTRVSFFMVHILESSYDLIAFRSPTCGSVKKAVLPDGRFPVRT